MAHILLASLGSSASKRSLTPPSSFAYDPHQGVWLNEVGDLLVYDERFAAVGTKKFDIETGEDYKGK